MRIPSTGNAQPLGRYSFLMADPFESIEVAADQAQPLDEISRILDQFQTIRIEDLPPMQGGVAGLFSYDLNRSFANIPAAKNDELAIPAIVVGAYDTVIAWDHEQNRAWIISQGFPETEAQPRAARAKSRIEFFANKLESSPPSQIFDKANDIDAPPSFSRQSMTTPIDRLPGLFSNFSKADYIATVQKCIDYIYAGDVFQINLAQQLAYPANCDSVELYCRLSECNPSPFGGYFDLSGISDCDAQIVTASPERLCSVRDRKVETRPIKGTRKRTGRPMVDIQARQELLSSVKDRAENTMIVDLMRNDLSMICDSDSVLVTQYCELEEYQSVMHLVSSVQGKLKPAHGLVDLLQAIFPGGSITGAPKVRAMEIIAELEPTARGAYCGALGYLGFDGSADLNILIRTITASHGWWQIPVGGGIVSQSNPEREYDETWTKAAGMLRAMTMN
jgi:para-aminobenzoate synthetase component 1